MFRICVLASGSNGNCTLIATERTCVLVDLGIGKRSLERRLQLANLGNPRIDAILLTHEHADHVGGVVNLLEEQDIPVFMNEGTREQAPDLHTIRKTECFSGSFTVGDLHVEPFAVSHDAAQPVGFRFSSRGICGTLVTDLGQLDKQVMARLDGCDWLILESNHDEEMVKVGPYPWFLKQRLLSGAGHLSNRELSRFLAGCFDGQAAHIFLAHLSRHNNDPEIAHDSASRALATRLFRKSWKLHLTHQNKPSIVIQL